MYYRSRKPPVQKYVLYAVVIVAAIGLVAFGGNAIRTELKAAESSAKPDQQVNSHYNAAADASQGTEDVFDNFAENSPAEEQRPPEASQRAVPESAAESKNEASQSRQAQSSREQKTDSKRHMSSETSGSASSSGSERSASSKKDKEEEKDKVEEKDYYTITAYEGNIAVFKNEETAPMTVLDIPIAYFPKNDQILLEAGIRVSSLSEAMQLLEDYQ